MDKITPLGRGVGQSATTAAAAGLPSKTGRPACGLFHAALSTTLLAADSALELFLYSSFAKSGSAFRSLNVYSTVNGVFTDVIEILIQQSRSSDQTLVWFWHLRGDGGTRVQRRGAEFFSVGPRSSRPGAHRAHSPLRRVFSGLGIVAPPAVGSLLGGVARRPGRGGGCALVAGGRTAGRKSAVRSGQRTGPGAALVPGHRPG